MIKEHIIRLYGLNEEQRKAFGIIANHSVSVNPEPLRMYIGGMGGTGKTRVIDALKYWFKLRGELHRMVVLAPTGAAASIINGSTYHSFLSIVTGKKRRFMERDGVGLGDAKKRMRGVDYIFLDEISMVSCQNFHLIDARLKEITGLFEVSFGGINMIVAGDFAQLPPAGREYSLYSGEVSKVQSARGNQTDEESTLGMLLWHQFVTVVILKQNMRQKAQTLADKQLRTALENMRYKACTDIDIAFLHTLVPSLNSALNIHDDQWRDVAVITPLNAHKDRINEINAKKFAAEHELVLHHFYSIDKKSEPKARSKKPKKTRKQTSAVRLTKSVQKILWNSPPFTSEQIPGCVSICLGMPIMIRYNDATELCITKGQEATVVGWTSHEIPDWPGYQTLDVLFVKLVKPPKRVKLPYLPANVVPLMKNTTSVAATLPNDQEINISCQQVPILLNFAMTDYASQGKTRDVNIVDITNSRSHMGIYTALSRGKYAASTMILRPFCKTKVTGGISGYLRQEFRDLDLLHEITELQYRGNLPDGIIQRLREPTLAAYDDYVLNPGDWRMPTPEKTRQLKRREQEEDISRQDENEVERPRKKSKTSLTDVDQSSLGFNSERSLTTDMQSWQWDGENWSCAYDSFFTVIRALWLENPIYWRETFEAYGSLLGNFAAGLDSFEKGECRLDDVRDRVRYHLWDLDSDSFPKGRTGTDMFELVSTLMDVGPTMPESISSRECSNCGRQCEAEQYESLTRHTVLQAKPGIESDSTVSAYVKDLETGTHQSECCEGVMKLRNTYPPLVCVQLPDCTLGPSQNNDIQISAKINLSGHRYRLAGVLYHDINAFHFACRVVDRNGEVYRYDGMEEGGRLRLDGMITSVACNRWLSDLGDKRAVLVIYAEVA